MNLSTRRGHSGFCLNLAGSESRSSLPEICSPNLFAIRAGRPPDRDDPPEVHGLIARDEILSDIIVRNSHECISNRVSETKDFS